MSVAALSNASPRRHARTAARHADAIAPARGVMVGLGLSAMIWAGIGALLFG